MKLRFSDIYLLCIAVPETLAHQLYQSLKNCLVRHVRGLQQVYILKAFIKLCHVSFEEE